MPQADQQKPEKTDAANWTSSNERSIKLVLEAHRRFMRETSNDAGTSRAMLLAWAMLEARRY